MLFFYRRSKDCFALNTDRNLNQLIRSVEASWDSLGSKLSCDGTPLDDEDAGIKKKKSKFING